MKALRLLLFTLLALALPLAAAQQTINLGTTANDGTGDTLRTAGGKINANFAELYSGTVLQPLDADLTIYAGITPSANVQTLLGSADYAAFRTSLSLVIGTNVQAYDADLTIYAGITPSANVQSLLGAADYSAARTLLSGGVAALTPAATVNIDFAGASVQTLALDQDTTLTTSNLAAGRSVTLRLSFAGGAVPGYHISTPDWQFSNATLEHIGSYNRAQQLEVQLRSYGTTDADVAAFVVEPAWTPALVPELRAWWQFDREGCFSDTAGTVPCAIDDPIARVRSRYRFPSAASFDLKQATSIDRPVLKAGGLCFSDLDGTQFMTLINADSGADTPGVFNSTQGTLYIAFYDAEVGLELLTDTAPAKGCVFWSGSELTLADDSETDFPQGLTTGGGASWKFMTVRSGGPTSNDIHFYTALQGGANSEALTVWTGARTVTFSRLGKSEYATVFSNAAAHRIKLIAWFDKYIAPNSDEDIRILKFILSHLGLRLPS